MCLRQKIALLAAIIILALPCVVPVQAQDVTREQIVRGIIEAVPPLANPLGGTLQPIRGSRLDGWLPDDDDEAREILRALHDRGVALTPYWVPNNADRQAFTLRMGRLQQELGLAVNVHGSLVMHGFFNGDEGTFHLADDGTPFSWQLFGSRKMGCPFRLKERAGVIKQQWEDMVEAYHAAGVRIDLVSMDWYADGPVEWNEAWEAARRCSVCREHIPQIERFTAFQDAVRQVRGELQRECMVDVVRARFPDVLIGNWAVYPNNGWRYWYDFYETIPDGAPFRRDQEALYRTWADEFSRTGYTYANPTCYPWNDMYDWYPEYPTDFRWFYMLLKTASMAGKSIPPDLPIITWVKWRPTPVRDESEPAPPMSLQTYRELLAHMLLRGSGGFMMWCRADETIDEVYAIAGLLDEALSFREFFEHGEPVFFDVPRRPGTVVSALRLDNRLLVRRTDFTGRPGPVTRRVGDVLVSIPPSPGSFVVVELPQRAATATEQHQVEE